MRDKGEAAQADDNLAQEHRPIGAMRAVSVSSEEARPRRQEGSDEAAQASISG
jgi:hypothetical protein